MRLGVVPDALYWIRCRAAGGVPDEAPVLRGLAVNAVLAEQCVPARAWLRRAPGAAPTLPPLVPGEQARLSIGLDADEHVVGVQRTAEPAVPLTRVLGVDADAIEATLTLVGVARGVPLQRFELPGAPVADGRLALWSIEADGPHAWEPRLDFDASSPAERIVVVDAQAGALRFGDGAQGRVPAEGAPLFAVYDSTEGARGNLDIAAVWSLAGADDDVNRALLGRDPAGVELAAIASCGAAWGGAAAEDVTHAAGRAAETLWAHERLLELAPNPDATLDGLDPQSCSRGWHRSARRTRSTSSGSRWTCRGAACAAPVPGRASTRRPPGSGRRERSASSSSTAIPPIDRRPSAACCGGRALPPPAQDARHAARRLGARVRRCDSRPRGHSCAGADPRVCTRVRER